MLHEFISGFYLVASFLVWLAGCLTAVLVGVLIAATVLAVASWVFDRFTCWLARRLHRKKRKPRNRLEKIILGSEENAV